MRTDAHMDADNRARSLFSHSRSHQIKAKGSGSRPRFALDSPGRWGGAVWAEVPRTVRATHPTTTLSFGNQKGKQNWLKPVSAARVMLYSGTNYNNLLLSSSSVYRPGCGRIIHAVVQAPSRVVIKMQPFGCGISHRDTNYAQGDFKCI